MKRAALIAGAIEAACVAGLLVLAACALPNWYALIPVAMAIVPGMYLYHIIKAYPGMVGKP